MANVKVYKVQGGDELVVASGGKLTVKEGATVTGLVDATTTPVASAEELGCVKVGDGLEISEAGVLSVDFPDFPQAEWAGECDAEDVDGCVSFINSLISTLVASGLMAAASGR